MRRSFRKFLRWSTWKHCIYVPAIVRSVENWWPFLKLYVGFNEQSRTFRLRNGLVIDLNQAVESENIATTFIKKEYGDVPDGSVVIDVGASIGDFALLAAQQGARTRVIAVEPMPATVALLEHNIHRNNFSDQITVISGAVAGTTGTQMLHTSDSALSHTLVPGVHRDSSHVPIQCFSLADVMLQHQIGQCDILKMDCEGAEYDILYNSTPETLKNIKEIRLEYHTLPNASTHPIHQLVTYLQEVGFTIQQGTTEARNAVIWMKQR
ncbi:MAG: FkbM family methyltransferase [Armatimonadetes bacterium]|nr:FkbM family methyltransferase [Armatimonadota bacterium]